MHTEPNVNFSVVILDILPFQFSMKNLRLCKHAHMMAHLPRPATQWTATQQPGSSRNLVFSKLNQLLTTSAGGGLPSSNCQSYKHRPVLSGVRNDSHKNTKCQSYKERPVLTRCKRKVQIKVLNQMNKSLFEDEQSKLLKNDQKILCHQQTYCNFYLFNPTCY